MIRFAFMALIAFGFVAAPMGDASVAHAQKAKKTVKRKKTVKTVKRTKKAVRKGSATSATKKSAKKAAKEEAESDGKLNVTLKVKAAIRNTNKVLEKAVGAVKIGTKGQDDLRSAVVRQHAARLAYAKGKREYGFYLTRLSRQLARSVIRANGMKAEENKADVLADPDTGDMEAIGAIIMEVEEGGKVVAAEKILEDETIGVDQPEDIGEDESDKLEKEVELEVETGK